MEWSSAVAFGPKFFALRDVNHVLVPKLGRKAFDVVAEPIYSGTLGAFCEKMIVVQSTTRL